MDTNEVNQKFEEIMKPKVIRIKERRTPAQFPELRWIAGACFIGSFTFMILCASVATLLESV
jgi:hypothetical protein